MIARQRSFYVDQMYAQGEESGFFAAGAIEPIFGMTIGIGSTF